MEEVEKVCSNCETKYTIHWDDEVQDLEPHLCPFCGYETDDEEDTIWTNESEDDNWN